MDLFPAAERADLDARDDRDLPTLGFCLGCRQPIDRIVIRDRQDLDAQARGLGYQLLWFQATVRRGGMAMKVDAATNCRPARYSASPSSFLAAAARLSAARFLASSLARRASFSAS